MSMRTTFVHAVDGVAVVDRVEHLPLHEAIVARTRQLQGEVDDFVAASVNPKEREALVSIAAGLDELRDNVRPWTELERGVRIGLMLARQWMHAAIGLGGLAKMQCEACTTTEELDAVIVDYDSLGPAPTVTAGEIAIILAQQEP